MCDRNILVSDYDPGISVPYSVDLNFKKCIVVISMHDRVSCTKFSMSRIRDRDIDVQHRPRRARRGDVTLDLPTDEKKLQLRKHPCKIDCVCHQIFAC
eukprot:SAG31_NODE_1112_length_9855_cov_13.754203_4_plen_98_part_00